MMRERTKAQERSLKRKLQQDDNKLVLEILSRWAAERAERESKAKAA